MKISFLSPAYNSAAWLKRMLDSIPKEYAYEILVCNDCSTDETGEILHEYAKHCPQLRVITNEINIGASLSYNRLIGEATGDYIAIIDSDDHYLPTIRDVLAQIDGQYDIYFYNMLTKSGEIYYKDPSNLYTWPGAFKIIRRSFIGSAYFTLRPDIAGDWDFNRMLINQNPTYKFTNIVAYWYNFYRENSESDLHLKGQK